MRGENSGITFSQLPALSTSSVVLLRRLRTYWRGVVQNANYSASRRLRTLIIRWVQVMFPTCQDASSKKQLKGGESRSEFYRSTLGIGQGFRFHR